MSEKAPPPPQTPPLVVPVPKTRAEAEKLLGQITVDTARLVMTQAILKERLTLAREGVEKQIADISTLLAAERDALADWAWSVKDTEFTEPKKSIQMLHGTVGFQLGRRTLELMARTEWTDVLARLKGKFKKFVRVKKEVDRATLLSAAIDQAKPIPAAELSKLGVKIVQGESFYVELKQI